MSVLNVTDAPPKDTKGASDAPRPGRRQLPLEPDGTSRGSPTRLRIGAVAMEGDAARSAMPFPTYAGSGKALAGRAKAGVAPIVVIR